MPASVHGFSLSSLLLVVTLAAVVFGMFGVAPGLGIVVGIAAVPALLRTGFEIRRRQQQGQAATVADEATLFAASLGVVAVAGVAASIAFSVVCCCSGFLGISAFGYDSAAPFAIAILLGGVAGIYVLVRVMKALPPRQTQ